MSRFEEAWRMDDVVDDDSRDKQGVCQNQESRHT